MWATFRRKLYLTWHGIVCEPDPGVRMLGGRMICKRCGSDVDDAPHPAPRAWQNEFNMLAEDTAIKAKRIAHLETVHKAAVDLHGVLFDRLRMIEEILDCPFDMVEKQIEWEVKRRRRAEAQLEKLKPLFAQGPLHVVPIGDLREHELSAECWCAPIEDADTPNLWSHNSADGREAFERGERKPS
jgi:hypothetical protein